MKARDYFEREMKKHVIDAKTAEGMKLPEPTIQMYKNRANFYHRFLALEDMMEESMRIINQFKNDLDGAHKEICKLQDLDPEKHTWPEWTPQANTLRWVEEFNKKVEAAIAELNKDED